MQGPKMEMNQIRMEKKMDSECDKAAIERFTQIYFSDMKLLSQTVSENCSAKKSYTQITQKIFAFPFDADGSVEISLNSAR